MAGRLTKNDWSRVSELLEADPTAFGMPEGGRERSLVLGSFNIRKLGAVDRRERELEFLARFCARCDLVAVQEVQDDLAGLRHLRARADAHVAGQGEFSLAVSDITGQVPGDPGMAERLGFLYRNRRIRRLDMASDLTFDRTAVLERLFAHEDVWQQARQDHDEKLAAFAAGERKTKPTFVPPVFLTFVRTPYVVAFEAPAAKDMPALTFTAVNAHLVYGSKKEREQEFAALLDWLIHRLKRASRLVAPNFVLLGDLNLDFDKPRKDRERIDALLRGLNAEAFGDPGIRRVYFPFLDRHPVLDKVFRTNARADQTFDQIAFFNGRRERRLPNDQWHALIAAGDADGFDYGVFDFADLFARASPRRRLRHRVRGDRCAGFSRRRVAGLNSNRDSVPVTTASTMSPPIRPPTQHRTGALAPRLLSVLALLLAPAPALAQAGTLSVQEGEDILVGSEAKEALIAFTNFVIGPGIPGTRLAVNRGGGRADERLSILKGSLQPEFDLGSERWRLRLDGGLGYVAATTPIDISDGAEPVRFDTERQLLSGRIGAGGSYLWFEHVDIRPMLSVAVSQIKSTADTNGVIPFVRASQADIVDWRVNVASLFGSLEIDYDQFWGDTRWEVIGTYSHGYHRSYNASRAFIEFSGHTDTVGALIRRSAHTGADLFSIPLDWNVFASYTGFIGLDPEVLGFNSLLSVGAGLDLRLQKRPFGIANLRSVGLNFSAVLGENVAGGTLGISFRN